MEGLIVGDVVRALVVTEEGLIVGDAVGAVVVAMEGLIVGVAVGALVVAGEGLIVGDDKLPVLIAAMRKLPKLIEPNPVDGSHPTAG
jgi:hypothetical protein